MKNSMKFPEIPKDFVRQVTPLTQYWVNAEGMLTLDHAENVLVTQVGSPIALYKADEVEARELELLGDAEALWRMTSAQKITDVDAHAVIKRLLDRLKVNK